MGLKKKDQQRNLWSLCSRATGNSRFEGDKFQVVFSKNPENSRYELMTYLQANTLIIARKWPKLTHFYQLHKTQ